MTHHPNTPASRTDLAVEWLRNNYQDYPNIASLCDAMREALAASRTEQAAPSVVSGVESGAVYWHNPENGQVWSDVDVRFHCKNTMGWTRVVIPAAPGAAIAAREQESSPGFTTKYPLLNDLLQETWWLGKGPNNHDTGMAWFESLERFLEWLAARQEAPAASEDDSLLLCVSDLQHSAIYDNHVEMQACIRAVAERIKALVPTAARSPATVAQPVELRGVAETLGDGGGFWRSCSGCYELNEGHDTGPYSVVLKCHLGGGCSECGGIGAIWDTTDYADIAALSGLEHVGKEKSK